MNRSIDFHNKVIKATVLSVQPDLWGITTTVLSEDLGVMVSTHHRYQTEHLEKGDSVSVRVYCSNLMMAPLFDVVQEDCV